MARVHDILGYEVLATLGHGARSTIFAVKDKDDQVFALKRVIKRGPEDQRFLDQAIHEHEVANSLDHPALRRSYKLIRRRAVVRTTEVHVLMEMVDGYTMEQYSVTSMAELCELFQRVAAGLGVMHEHGYVHADIKPNNIMVTDNNTVKIIDFGQSCAIKTVKERIQGTPDYIAPEQVQRKEIIPQTDMFNLAATIYWLVTNQHVPTMIPKKEMNVGLKTKSDLRPPAELNPEVPPALNTLLMECLERRPDDRPRNMQVIQDRLQMAIGQMRTPAAAPVDTRCDLPRQTHGARFPHVSSRS